MEDAMNGRSKSKSLGWVGVSVAILCLLSACGTVEHKLTLVDNFSPESTTAIEVGKITNETGKTFGPEIDLEDMLRRALTEKLTADYLLSNNTTQDKLILDSKILDFDEGNAFKRWLLPGWGATVLTIQSDLRKNGQLVGTVDAKRTVSAGGAYTIGAWKTIFDGLAGDVVEDLRSRIPNKQPAQ
jgi:hypothetical protein